MSEDKQSRELGARLFYILSSKSLVNLTSTVPTNDLRRGYVKRFDGSVRQLAREDDLFAGLGRDVTSQILIRKEDNARLLE